MTKAFFPRQSQGGPQVLPTLQTAGAEAGVRYWEKRLCRFIIVSFAAVAGVAILWSTASGQVQDYVGGGCSPPSHSLHPSGSTDTHRVSGRKIERLNNLVKPRDAMKASIGPLWDC